MRKSWNMRTNYDFDISNVPTCQENLRMITLLESLFSNPHHLHQHFGGERDSISV